MHKVVDRWSFCVNNVLTCIFLFVSRWLGYAFFGMVCFGSFSDRFESFSASMITLFAVLNGDVIRETFLNLSEKSPYVSQVYMYTFICLFIYVVLNVFIAIIEEAFFSAWEEGKKVDAKKEQVKQNNGKSTSRSSSESSDEPMSYMSSKNQPSELEHEHQHGHQHGHGHGHGKRSGGSSSGGSKESEVSRRSQAQMFSQGNMFAGSEDGGLGGKNKIELKSDSRQHRRQVTPNKNIVKTNTPKIPQDTLMRDPGSASMARSWNKFKEMLYNVEQEELEQRHAMLHEEDLMMHEELERRANSFVLAEEDEEVQGLL